jgi:hypothetical protein
MQALRNVSNFFAHFRGVVDEHAIPLDQIVEVSLRILARWSSCVR